MRISAMSTQISKVAISVECHSIAEGSELGPSTGTVLLRLNLMLISEPPNDLQCRLKGVLESIEPSLLEAFELEALSTRSRVSFVEWLTSLRIETKLALLGRLLSLRLISEPLHIVIQDGCSRDADSIRRTSGTGVSIVVLRHLGQKVPTLSKPRSIVSQHPWLKPDWLAALIQGSPDICGLP